MSLNESIVADTALGWFGELGYAVERGPHLAPAEPAAERVSFSEVLLVERLREAISSRSLTTLRGRLLQKLLSGRLSPTIK